MRAEKSVFKIGLVRLQKIASARKHRRDNITLAENYAQFDS